MENSKNIKLQSPRNNNNNNVAPERYHSDVLKDIAYAKVITKITEQRSTNLKKKKLDRQVQINVNSGDNLICVFIEVSEAPIYYN